jgi:hypothetical protein
MGSRLLGPAAPFHHSAAANTTGSINVASSSSVRELLTRFDTGPARQQIVRGRLEPDIAAAVMSTAILAAIFSSGDSTAMIRPTASQGRRCRQPPSYRWRSSRRRSAAATSAAAISFEANSS